MTIKTKKLKCEIQLMKMAIPASEINVLMDEMDWDWAEDSWQEICEKMLIELKQAQQFYDWMFIPA